MDLLDQSVLPQSPHHLELIRYLLSLSFIIFIPFISLLTGTLSLSLYFRKKGLKTRNNLYKIFSKDLIDLATFNKSVSFAFAIIPLLSAIFGYSQLLHSGNTGIPGFLLVSLILLVISLLLIYTYKYTFHLKEIFQYAEINKNLSDQEGEINNEISSYTEKASLLNNKSGLYGLILLLLSVYIFTGSVSLATDSVQWEAGGSFLGIIFSFSSLIGFAQFLTGSAVITSAFVLFKMIKLNDKSAYRNEEYLVFVRNYALKTGLISIIIFILVIAVTVLAKPVNSLSFSYFGIIPLILIILLLTSSFFYFMIKESNTKYIRPVLYLVITAFILLVFKDQFAFETSTKLHSEILAKQYDEYIKKIEEASGTTAPVNGADIFNGRCIACHTFDHKLVGPPYKQTLPKYEGKMKDLVAFILNPVKKNPEFPPMPNQGLKQKEAEAVAEYIMNTYKKNP